MSNILEEYSPSDEFIIKMQNISITDFNCDYVDTDDKKKLRNAFDNRMRKTNITLYYMHELLNPRMRTIGTQTDLTGRQMYLRTKKSSKSMETQTSYNDHKIAIAYTPH